jgi:FKBP-type peptidyl-prolyl cis-trans isomerase 2
MQPVQHGDRVQVHYVKRLSDGSAATSRGRAPLELTAGCEHPRLPGLGTTLEGLFPGDVVTVSIPPDHAYGLYETGRVRCWARSRFPHDEPLAVGKRVRILDKRGRCRSVRVLEVRESTVLVDTNHRFAGQTLEIKVKVIRIEGRAGDSGTPAPESRRDPGAATRTSAADARDGLPRDDPWREVGGEA